MGGDIARMGEIRNAYKIRVGKPEGNRPLGRPRHGRIILEWILGKLGGKVRTGSKALRKVAILPHHWLMS
jgi:hypothetical protein